MNTQAIATSIPSSGATASRHQTSNTANSDSSFSQLLNREISERHTTESVHATPAKESSAPGKSANQADNGSTSTVDESKSKDSAESVQAEASSVTEQMLVMAGQFSPTIQATQLASIAQNLPAAIQQPLAVPAPLSVESTQSTDVSADSAALQIETSISNSAEFVSPPTAGKVEQNTAAFDLTMAKTAERNRVSVPIANSGNTFAPETISEHVTPASKTNEPMALSLAGLSTTELHAQPQQDAGDELTATTSPLQQAMVNQAQLKPGSSADKLTPHVGTTAWNQAVGQKIVWMIGREQQSASLTLNPPDLGPLQVVLSVSSTQANASFYAAQPEVRHALEAALPKLREMLADAGIQLGQANVSAGTPQRQDSYATHPSAILGTNTLDDVAHGTTPAVERTTRIVREGLIDTFA